MARFKVSTDHFAGQEGEHVRDEGENVVLRFADGREAAFLPEQVDLVLDSEADSPEVEPAEAVE